ncbi:immunoglobulin-binding protein 1 [Oreochromis aureus]|uniref:immunoglobulin-binding protein 1 n=1 Tax=Oreochromis aureus TaxID=47969 RepID=UPI001953600C|nr:immunoglobulin-binding protein 1 [Oreochromis aureus]
MAESENSNSVRQPLNVDAEPLKLSELLDRGWKIFEEVDSTNEPLGSNSIQVKVKRGVQMLEEASRMVAQLDLFSRNEELEEIATVDLKYLLLPALLGALTMKQTTRDKPPGTNGDSFPGPTNLVAMAAQRQAKIERYRQKKELEAKLSDVRRAVESGQADDEVTRDFYLLNVRRWVTVCLEEVESIDQEVEILKKMDMFKENPPKQPSHPSRPPMKPFILTKDAVQAKVFGAGYPSLPTMTVDDWYEQHKKHGVLPDQGVPRKATAEDHGDPSETDEEEKEKKVENDDDESLLKARNWDDWKDTHRRGYGNRQNMG